MIWEWWKSTIFLIFVLREGMKGGFWTYEERMSVKYLPEVYISEKSKILKKIRKVVPSKLLTLMWFLLRSDNYFRRTRGWLFYRPDGRVSF